MQRRGDWQTTASGKTVWPLDPRPEDIEIGDIAHHLARLNRWGGAIRSTYSVAEHSVLLSVHFSSRGKRSLARWALLHDAAEAYLGDIPRPLKPFFTDYARFERGLERVIWDKFGLRGPLPPEVKAADTAILGDERDQLFKTSAQAKRKRPGETGLNIYCYEWAPKEAERCFLEHFEALFPEVAL
jgi:5'-deoxynucleotidase YfbR-like HD superfamily hydrolase